MEMRSNYNTSMTKQADLVAYLFAGQADLLAAPLAQWMGASPRFTAFVEIYRDKIRKKIRLARGPESVLDLEAELEVAFCLLNDRRLSLQYEPYASEKRRGPDFAVTYRTNLVFNLEVARIRAGGIVENGLDVRRIEERILRILFDKLGQMQAGMANLLVIQLRSDQALAIDLRGLMQAVKTRADGRDAAFYAASRHSSPAAFYKDYLNLSCILLWAPAAQMWVNKQARSSLAEEVLRLVSSLASCTGQLPAG